MPAVPAGPVHERAGLLAGQGLRHLPDQRAPKPRGAARAPHGRLQGGAGARGPDGRRLHRAHSRQPGPARRAGRRQAGPDGVSHHQARGLRRLRNVTHSRMCVRAWAVCVCVCVCVRV